ncbi:hypothetical protein EC973_006405 [Apophysomyces ossiformis]|uniref:Uncharacterized protein n=1 Tax=Apophysomyces ossiformis TaxID=679940 RepID=A0A8H7ET57_9FUNG|nr:hypothetical protein EC973_006405 [Apophysomyces ossiformis]
MSRLPTQTLRAKGFIFDLDGTMIDTTPLVERHWRTFAAEHGLDADKILATSHGRRTIETLELWTPHLAKQEIAEGFERELAKQSDGLSVLPGVRAMLEKIPTDRYGIFTAANRHMAEIRLKQCNLDIPKVMATGDTVSRGKPDPEGCFTVATALQVNPRDCLVFEDSPHGIAAAREAGMQSIGCTTTHTVDQLKKAGATQVVSYFTDVDITLLPDGTFELTITNAL